VTTRIHRDTDPGQPSGAGPVTHDRLPALLEVLIDPFILMEAIRDDDGILIDLRYVEANEAAVTYNQLTRDEMIGARLLDLFPGQLEHGPLKQYFHTIETGEPTVLDDYAYPHEIIGQERRYDIRATKAGDGLALTWRDVTDRHRAERALAERERLYRLLADHSSDVIALSADGRTLSWVSDSAETVLGYPPEDLIGHAPTEYLHPDDVPALLTAIEHSDDTGNVARLRSRWRLPDGSYCWVESAGSPIPDDESGGTGRVITIHRVDDKVRDEQELADRERRYRLLAENSYDVVLYAEDGRTISWVSESVRTTLGYSPEQLIGLDTTELVHPDDLTLVRDSLRTSIDTQTPSRMRLRLRLPDETYAWLEVAGSPVKGSRARVITSHRIDEQVAAEQELADRERLYRMLAENSEDVILLTTSDTTILWASPSAATTFGWQPEDLVGRSAIDLVHPDDRDRVQAGITESNRSGTPFMPRERHRLADGSYRWVLASGHPLTDPETGEGRRIVTLRDIQAQVEAETELQESERLYRLLTDNSSDIVMLVDADLTMNWVSPAMTRVLGWPLDEVVGTSSSTLIHPDDLPGLIEIAQRSLETGTDTQYRYRWRTATGGYRWMEGRGHIVNPEAHDGVRVVRIRDITDQVAAEQDLAERERLYHLLADNSSDVILMADPEGRLLWASAAAQSTLDWNPDDLVGHPVSDFVHPDDVAALTAAISQSTESRDVAVVRYRWRHGDGHYSWVEGAGRPFVDDHTGEVRRVVRLRDVEAEVRAEHNLAASEELYRLIAENSSDVVILADEQNRALWISPSVTPTLGWQPEDVVGHQAHEFLHPDDWQADDHRGEADRRPHFNAPQRLRMNCKDGSWRWMEVIARQLPLPAGQPPRNVVRLRDIDKQVEAEGDLADTQELYRLLAENSSDVVIVADEQGVAQWVSPSCRELVGLEPEAILGHPPFDFLHPDDVESTRVELMRSVRTGTPARMTYRFRKGDGSYVWMDAGASKIPATDDEPVRRVMRLRDVHSRVTAEEELASSEKRFRVLAENASDVVWQVKDDGTLLWISPSVEATLGWKPEELVGSPKQELVVPEDRERFLELVNTVAAHGTASGNFRVRCAHRDPIWMQITIRQAVGDGESARIGTLRDIHDEVESRHQLEFALQHDQTTGLPTRRAITDRITRAAQQMRSGDQVALFTIGIDLLKDVNDAYGHGTGDVVIATVAARLAAALDQPELLGRGTGDEFISAVVGTTDAAEAAEVAERLRGCVHGPIEVTGGTVTTTVSIGIAIGSRGSDAEDLLRDATLAMHRAKELGRDRWAFANAELATEAAQRMAVESAIRTGLDLGEFEPWFQPIVSLADNSLTGYEALVRWRRDDRHMAPDEFLSVAERTPMMTDIDMAMVEPVVTQLARLPVPLYVAVNVTAPTLAHSAYPEHVARMLKAHDVDPVRLHIEVTETMLLTIDPAIVARMQELGDVGVKWYVDDFGTGYSSISHLRDLPVSGLKLDKSFTDGIGAGDPTDRQLADALLGLANGLGLDTVAEGVETEAEAAYLRTLGWRHGQGYLYGKPAPLP